jgi:hypothetical protein
MVRARTRVFTIPWSERSGSFGNCDMSPRIPATTPMSDSDMPIQSVAQYTMVLVDAIFATWRFCDSPALPMRPWPYTTGRARPPSPSSAASGIWQVKLAAKDAPVCTGIPSSARTSRAPGAPASDR